METPDHASIWRFRQTIDKLGLSAALLDEVNSSWMRWASSSSAARSSTRPRSPAQSGALTRAEASTRAIRMRG
jgi:hypothetical protein